MPGYFLTFEFLDHLSSLLLKVCSMLKLKCFIDDVIFGVVQELKHLELMLQHFVA